MEGTTLTAFNEPDIRDNFCGLNAQMGTHPFKSNGDHNSAVRNERKDLKRFNNNNGSYFCISFTTAICKCNLWNKLTDQLVLVVSISVYLRYHSSSCLVDFDFSVYKGWNFYEGSGTEMKGLISRMFSRCLVWITSLQLCELVLDAGQVTENKSPMSFQKLNL